MFIAFLYSNKKSADNTAPTTVPIILVRIVFFIVIKIISCVIWENGNILQCVAIYCSELKTYRFSWIAPFGAWIDCFAIVNWNAPTFRYCIIPQRTPTACNSRKRSLQFTQGFALPFLPFQANTRQSRLPLPCPFRLFCCFLLLFVAFHRDCFTPFGVRNDRENQLSNENSLMLQTPRRQNRT